MTEHTGRSNTATLLDRLCGVEFPTLGHYLEDGFCSPEIRRMVAGARMVGIAATALVRNADAGSVNRAILRLRPGEVLVLDMGGDREHAPVGAVTAAAALAQGAAGILLDGPMTDVEELNAATCGNGTLPIFARGSTCLTTKRKGTGDADFDVPVMAGGVTVYPGDIVLGDANGALVLPPSAAERIIDQALTSDAEEPEILRQIAAGEPLEQILYLS